MGVCNYSMFCCTLLYVHSSIAIILMGKRELITLLNLSSWCLEMVKRLFLEVPRGCLKFVIVVIPDHTHLLFFSVHGINTFTITLQETNLFMMTCTDPKLNLFLKYMQCIWIKSASFYFNRTVQIKLNCVRQLNSV